MEIICGIEKAIFIVLSAKGQLNDCGIWGGVGLGVLLFVFVFLFLTQ